MICPNCASVICREQYEGVAIEACPECKGQWLEGKHLRTIERRREVDVSQPSTVQDPRRPQEAELARNCPRCMQPMKKYRYGKDKSVIVDQCVECKGIWLDDGELEAIQRAYERWEDFVQEEGGTSPAKTLPRPTPARQAIAANVARGMTRTSLMVLAARWILSLLILFAPAVAILYFNPELAGLKFWGVYLAVWVVILLIAHYVEFCPDTDDLGLFGGWVDDPFSWSDDRNRSLLWLQLLFIMPKFVDNTFEKTLEALRN